MSKKQPPATSKQVECLEAVGIIPPETSAACSNLIGWVFQYDSTLSTRIALLKSAQQKFVGKRVSYFNGKRTGTVRHVLHNKDAVELSCVASIYYGRERNFGPINALVEWDTLPGDKKFVSRVVLSTLEVIS